MRFSTLFSLLSRLGVTSSSAGDFTYVLSTTGVSPGYPVEVVWCQSFEKALAIALLFVMKFHWLTASYWHRVDICSINNYNISCSVLDPPFHQAPKISGIPDFRSMTLVSSGDFAKTAFLNKAIDLSLASLSSPRMSKCWTSSVHSGSSKSRVSQYHICMREPPPLPATGKVSLQ